MTDLWSRLSHALATLPPAEPPPSGARLGAALALFAGTGDGDAELVLTRRREDLRHHPGQVSFPGGRVDAGETVEETALREAWEECGVDPATVEVLGRLPAFYIPPSRFWFQVVVGHWGRPHPLRAAEAEVAEILLVPLSLLRDERRWRAVRRIHHTATWAWQLDGGHVLWGATGMVTAGLLGLLDPGWHGGRSPDDLPADREVEPWAHPGTSVPRPGPARLPGVPEVPLEEARRAGDELAREGGEVVVAAGAPATGEADAGVAAAAAEVAAEAVAQLLPAGGSVLLLSGPGRTGALGLLTALRLVERGIETRAVLASTDAHPAGAEARRRLGRRCEVFGGSLPRADLVVDALLGRGLRGALRPPVREVVVALRGHSVPVISLDLPSGIDPSHGFVGDTVAADVTLSLGTPPDGLLQAGLGPFVGDLYVVGALTGADPVVRVVPSDGGDDAGSRACA